MKTDEVYAAGGLLWYLRTYRMSGETCDHPSFGDSRSSQLRKAKVWFNDPRVPEIRKIVLMHRGEEARVLYERDG